MSGGGGENTHSAKIVQHKYLLVIKADTQKEFQVEARKTNLI